MVAAKVEEKEKAATAAVGMEAAGAVASGEGGGDGGGEGSGEGGAMGRYH